MRNQVYVETDGRNVGDTNDDHSKQHSDVNKISKSATIRCTLKVLNVCTVCSAHTYSMYKLPIQCVVTHFLVKEALKQY